MSWKLITSHLFVAVVTLVTGLLVLGPTRVATDPDIPAKAAQTNKIVGVNLVPESTHTQSGTAHIPPIDQSSIFEIQFNAFREASMQDRNALTESITRHLHSEDPLYSQNIALIYLERLIAIDPLGAARFADAWRGHTLNRQVLLTSVITSWVRYDAQAAIQYLANLPDLQTRYQISQRLMLDPTFIDTAATEQLAMLLGNQGKQMLAATRQLQKPPVELFEEALSMSGSQRAQALTVSLMRMWETDPDAVLARLPSLTAGERQMVMGTLVSTVSRRDPVAALELARTHAPGNLELEGQALTMLAAYDPDLAMPALEAYINRTGNHGVLTTALTMLAQRDLDRAIAYASGISAPYRSQVIQSLTMNYMQMRPAEAMEWVLRMGDSSATSMALGILPTIDLALAESYLGQLRDSSQSAQLLQRIASQKATDDLSSALDWLATYKNHSGYREALAATFVHASHMNLNRVPDALVPYAGDPAFGHAFSSVAGALANQQPREAAAWVRSLPEGSNRNAAIGSLSMAVLATDPELAVNLVNDMSPAYRETIATQMAYMLIMRDPDRFDEFIGPLGLTDEQISQIRERSRSGPAGLYPGASIHGNTRFGVQGIRMGVPPYIDSSLSR